MHDYSNDFRLMSINEVAHTLGVRHQSVKKLISEGKLVAVKIGRRTKIPVMSLYEFLHSEAVNPQPDNGIISIEETQNKIDALIKEYQANGNTI